MSSRKQGRRKRKKGHRRTNSNILASGDADALQAILQAQHTKQQKPKEPSQGSIQSTIQSIDHILDANKFSCNKFIIYDILCVIIAFSQMLFYYNLIGEYGKDNPILFKISCLTLLTTRFIWSLYLSHYMQHEIIPYLNVYCIILTDFVLPFFLMFKYCSSDLYAKKSLNHAIRSQLFLISIPMSIIQVIHMTLNNDPSIPCLISISIMIISITMEYWKMIKWSLNLKIRLFHGLSLFLDIIKFFINIHAITCMLSGKYGLFMTLLCVIIAVKTLMVTPCLAMIIIITRHYNPRYKGYNPMRNCCESLWFHMQYCWNISSYHFGIIWGIDFTHRQWFIVFENIDKWIIYPIICLVVYIYAFFYIWIALEITFWSSFWFIFHSHYNSFKNVFGIHSDKLKYILSFLLKSINSFDFKIRLYCLHYILYDGYGWWQRKHYFYKIEKILQKYIHHNNNKEQQNGKNIEKKLDISLFTPSDKSFVDEINNNVRYMISHLLQNVLKIACIHYSEYKAPTKKQEYFLYTFYGFNIYSSIIFPLILLVYNWIFMVDDTLLFKLLCGYFIGLGVMSYFMFEYYRYLNGWWHCSLINFQYPIKIELLAPFYEYIHTYYAKIEIIKTYFGQLSDLMINLMGYDLRASSQSILRSGMKYASEKNDFDTRVYHNFTDCQEIVLNMQNCRKLCPNFKSYLFDLNQHII